MTYADVRYEMLGMEIGAVKIINDMRVLRVGANEWQCDTRRPRRQGLDASVDIVFPCSCRTCTADQWGSL